MAHQIRDVMTPNPITLPFTATAVDAAKAMRVARVIVVDSPGRGIVPGPRSAVSASRSAAYRTQ